MKATTLEVETVRMRLTIRGAVQGVGFRPFVYRLARELGLAGWVRNSTQGVLIEVEGRHGDAEEFRLRLDSEKPPLAAIHGMESSVLDVRGEHGFEILASETEGETTAAVLPDIATCGECRKEIFDRANRRYRYPFTNCTNCGPRFSILEALPYDRANTTMRGFAMCAACRSEYEDPSNRRFHAQPNACAQCGPHLELWNRKGFVLAAGDSALTETAAAVREGAIVAVKGLGGFHLVADARSEPVVERLRRLKHREAKPIAVMCPSLASVEEHCLIAPAERRLLRSPEAPIVLLRRRPSGSGLARAVAPGNPYLGVMLPYTPLHHLLLTETGFPIVATSGNLAEEPICTDENEAIERLAGIADLFLVHNRPIARHVDDSVVRIMAGREMVVRRARGYSPLPIRAKSAAPGLLAVGGHQKDAIAISTAGHIFVSQHIGDLATAQAYEAFRRVITDFERLYGIACRRIACDLHPDYLSTKYANGAAKRVHPVQHHVAHVASCVEENEIEGPVLGVAWDGNGHGTDGTVWGGEFLLVEGATWRRVAHLRTFLLPGGETAMREPSRAAVGLLYSLLGDEAFRLNHLPALRAFSEVELRVLKAMVERGVNSPPTSSAGRLFDAVAAIIDVRQENLFEGQAAMELEFALEGYTTDEHYDTGIDRTAGPSALPLVVDWGPMMRSILNDAARGIPLGRISAQFHNTLVEMILAVARRVGEPRVVLSGGCFQNRYLTERAIGRLREEGFAPYWHQRVPPNDGGIALGQAAMASHAVNTEGK